jgi:hypothetical protein
MASLIRMSSEAVNAEADALRALANGGYLRIYDGVQPLTANTAVSTQVVLAQLVLNATAFSAAASGVITANSITSDTDADADGTASWYRVFKSDGVTPLWDGTVGTVGCDINLNAASIVSGAEVGITSFTHTVTKG